MNMILGRKAIDYSIVFNFEKLQSNLSFNRINGLLNYGIPYKEML